jgi:hypothetical protein
VARGGPWPRSSWPPPNSSGRAPAILCEALSRCLGRVVTPDEIGLPGDSASSPHGLDWDADTLAGLADLGRADVDADRRRVIGAAAYSVAGLAIPGEPWWRQMAGRGHGRGAAAGRRVGRGDVEAVREMFSTFSRIDQRRGGGHARTAVVQYLTADVAGYVRGRYLSEQVRREMFSAASELAYLAGWMAFDNSAHALAQRYFTVSVKLAAVADDPPLAGHVLRAMAHQAVDLGHPQQALDLASASVGGQRYVLAAPRERALLGVVHARCLAAVGQHQAAAAALTHAEDDLAAAAPGDGEPSRVFFFGEASLAHETARTLRETGDLAGAADMRTAMSTFRRRGVAAVAELDARAASYLAGA